MNVEIRRANLDDLGIINELYCELLGSKSDMSKTIDSFYEINADDRKFLLVASEKVYGVVGTAYAVVCPSLAFNGKPFTVVDFVVVNNRFQHNGVGKALMTYIDGIAQETNSSSSFLVSSEFRKEAHMFYKNLGYKDNVVGFRKTY